MPPEETVTESPEMAGAPIASVMIDIMADGTFVANPEPVEGAESVPQTFASAEELTAYLQEQAGAPEVEEPEIPVEEPMVEPAPEAAPKKKPNPMAMFGNPNR
jgi:hypothetical protein